MKLYRFSQIASESELMQALEYLHTSSHQLCKEVIGEYLPVRGNIGIFCHHYDEFAYLTRLREQLTHGEPSYNGKYFPLKVPLPFSEKDGIPAATYEYLYIRQVDPYRSQVGDVDFVMQDDAFDALKSTLAVGEFRSGARVFERMEENLIELWTPQYDVVNYVANDYMRDRAKP